MDTAKSVDVVPEHARKGLGVMNANAAFASLPIDRQQFIIQSTLERALNDERIEDIAVSFGLKRSTLNYNLLAHANDEWRDTQAARALTNLQDAEEAVKNAPDGLSLGRARESLKSAQWALEKLHRRLYGDKIEVAHSGHVAVTVMNYCDAPQQTPIDVTPTKDE